MLSLAAVSARRVPYLAASCAAVMLALVGCGVDVAEPYVPVTDAARLYFALTLDHKAINLSTVAPYDTIRLVATPRNAQGQALSGMAAPTFHVSDTLSLRVGPDGLVQALQPGQGMLVVAELTDGGNVRHVDTAVVNVSSEAAPPTLQSLSIHAVPPELPVRAVAPQEGFFGAVLEIAGIPVLPPVVAHATDAGGLEIPGLAVHYESRNPAIATINHSTGEIFPMRPGQVRIVATTTAYGVTKADSADYTIAPPVYQGIPVEHDSSGTVRFALDDVVIGRDGVVFWYNPSAGQVDIVFEGPGPAEEMTPVCNAFGPPLCGGGNIEAFGDAAGDLTTIRVRRFPTPGVYTYRSPLTGATGRIVVDEQSPYAIAP